MSNTNTWDDREFQKALKAYLNIKKNVDPKKELKRRAKNIGMKLVKIYKEKGVVLSDITAKVNSLGFRVKIRPKLRAKAKVNGWNFKRMRRAEAAARRSAKGFTSTGWFPAVEKLGGNPKRQVRAGTGPRRGKLIEKLSGSNISETLVNQQPGASVVMTKAQSPIQKAMDAETLDMANYIVKKQNDAARRNGL